MRGPGRSGTRPRGWTRRPRGRGSSRGAGPGRGRGTATITAPKVPYVLSPTRFRRTATAVAPRTIWKNTWRERRDATKGATLSWNHRVTAPITATKARNGAWFGRGRDTGTGLRFGRARHPGRRHHLTSVRRIKG